LWEVLESEDTFGDHENIVILNSDVGFASAFDRFQIELDLFSPAVFVEAKDVRSTFVGEAADASTNEEGFVSANGAGVSFWDAVGSWLTDLSGEVEVEMGVCSDLRSRNLR